MVDNLHPEQAINVAATSVPKATIMWGTVDLGEFPSPVHVCSSCRSSFVPEHSCLSLFSGRSRSSSHDSEEGVDVVALDGVSAGSDHLVFGLTH